MELFILNQDFERVDLLDEYDSLIWTDRYFESGDFEIYTASSKRLMDNMKLGYYLKNLDSEHSMIIESVKLESNIETGSYMTFTGRSLESILDRRIVWSQIVLDGYLEGQVEKLLSQNIMYPAISERRISNFIYVPSGDSVIEKMKISSQYTGDNLYDVIVKICKDNNIGFKITLSESNILEFKLYRGSDRSYDQMENPYVVFSPNFENIINSVNTNSTSSLKTVGLVAGQGEGSERKTVVVGNQNSSGLNRREEFIDARDISQQDDEGNDISISKYNEMLIQRGNEKMTEYKENHTFDGQVESTQLYVYGGINNQIFNSDDMRVRFFIGDIVQLEDEYQNQRKARVTEYIYSEDSNGINNYPTFSIMDD